jgi:hypothetical protein
MYLVGDGESFKNQDGEQVQIEKKRQNQPQLISCLRLGLSCWLCIRNLFLVVIIPRCTLLTWRGEKARFRFKTSVRCLWFQ